MMVIQGTQPGSNDVRIFPADRCTWVQGVSPTGGYTIDSARFYDGVSTTPIGIGAPALGYIGKSGRFVRIAD